MTADSWNRIKRLLSFITGIALWIVSIVFSYQGFKISNNDVAWAGIVLSFAVTVLELIFNTNTLNGLLNENIEFGEWILVLGGAIAYIYDVWTNILGFYVMQNKPAPETITLGFVVPFLFGMLVAILPEPMFVWAMGWNKSNSYSGIQGSRPKDFIGTPIAKSNSYVPKASAFLTPEAIKRIQEKIHENINSRS